MTLTGCIINRLVQVNHTIINQTKPKNKKNDMLITLRFDSKNVILINFRYN